MWKMCGEIGVEDRCGRCVEIFSVSSLVEL